MNAYVVAYNQYDHLSKTVKTLYNTSGNSVKKITVIDCSPQRLRFVDCYYDVIHLPYNPSLARVWNMCIGMSDTEWTMISNDDVVFREGWVRELECHHQKGVVWHGPSYCFMVHRDCIKQAGWFDERFLGMGYEDLDYVRRMRHAKVKACYGDACSCKKYFRHDRVRTSKELLDERQRFGQCNGRFFTEKYKNHDSENFDDPPLFDTPNFHWRTPWLQE